MAGVTFEIFKVAATPPIKLPVTVDHTYVMIDGSPYHCWGSASGGTAVIAGTGDGSFQKRYRCPHNFAGKLRKDTAGIGVYGVAGVCHQTANCFMLKSGVHILDNNSVKGYTWSLGAFGKYGHGFPKRRDLGYIMTLYTRF